MASLPHERTSPRADFPLSPEGEREWLRLGFDDNPDLVPITLRTTAPLPRRALRLPPLSKALLHRLEVGDAPVLVAVYPDSAAGLRVAHAWPAGEALALPRGVDPALYLWPVRDLCVLLVGPVTLADAERFAAAALSAGAVAVLAGVKTGIVLFEAAP